MTRIGVPRRIGAVGVATAALALAGCSTILAVRGQQERARANAIVSGTVEMDGAAHGSLIVGLVARDATGSYFLVDHFVAERPGPWIFAVAPGTYWLAAFEDANGDGRYDDEPALVPDPAHPLVLTEGERRNGVALRIPRDGRFRRGPFSLEDLRPRDPIDQERVSLFARSVAGTVTSLDDPRFAPEIAREGMWQYYDFLLDTEPGIYFLEPWDPKKIPVLFVHGIEGTPRSFAPLVAALDHERFQAWVAYYPSGAALDGLATWMTQLFVRLRVEYGFDRAAVVAHSMGGLVTRGFLLEDWETNGTKSVRTYVTISSPLGGMASAGAGVERSPVVVHSWRGLAPGSAYLDGLFYRGDVARGDRRRLPAHMAYHMLFGFRGASSDGVVAIASQLRPEAQEEARSLRGFDDTHVGILSDPAAIARVNEILADLH